MVIATLAYGSIHYKCLFWVFQAYENPFHMKWWKSRMNNTKKKMFFRVVEIIRWWPNKGWLSWQECCANCVASVQCCQLFPFSFFFKKKSQKRSLSWAKNVTAHSCFISNFKFSWKIQGWQHWWHHHTDSKDMWSY